jgi:hypothetical protein
VRARAPWPAGGPPPPSGRQAGNQPHIPPPQAHQPGWQREREREPLGRPAGRRRSTGQQPTTHTPTASSPTRVADATIPSARTPPSFIGQRQCIQQQKESGDFRQPSELHYRLLSGRPGTTSTTVSFRSKIPKLLSNFHVLAASPVAVCSRLWNPSKIWAAAPSYPGCRLVSR